MPASSFRATIDRDQEKRMLAAYTPREVKIILKAAAQLGAKGGMRVMRDAAPVGTSQRPSQYYRKMGLKHGTFAKSVRASAIRRAGDTVGQVIGPMGKNAFTRGWIETRTGWVARIASSALSVAREASEALLEQYAREH